MVAVTTDFPSKISRLRGSGNRSDRVTFDRSTFLVPAIEIAVYLTPHVCQDDDRRHRRCDHRKELFG